MPAQLPTRQQLSNYPPSIADALVGAGGILRGFLALPFSFATANNAVLFTVPQPYRMHIEDGYWEPLVSLTDGVASAIGVSSSNAGYNTAGEGPAWCTSSIPWFPSHELARACPLARRLAALDRDALAGRSARKRASSALAVAHAAQRRASAETKHRDPLRGRSTGALPSRPLTRRHDASQPLKPPRTQPMIENVSTLRDGLTTPLKAATSSRAFLTTREVTLALAKDDEIHALVLRRFRDLGGDAQRWQPRDRTAMARAISCAEDRLEGARGRAGLAAELRDVRRRLEGDA